MFYNSIIYIKNSVESFVISDASFNLFLVASATSIALTYSYLLEIIHLDRDFVTAVTPQWIWLISFFLSFLSGHSPVKKHSMFKTFIHWCLQMYLNIFCQIALAVDLKLVKGYRAYSNAHTSSINQALRTGKNWWLGMYTVCWSRLL